MVHQDSVNVIRELRNYAWKRDYKTNQVTNQPEDDNNHALDASAVRGNGEAESERWEVYPSVMCGITHFSYRESRIEIEVYSIVRNNTLADTKSQIRYLLSRCLND
jgi:hypothetical protein